MGSHYEHTRQQAAARERRMDAFCEHYATTRNWDAAAAHAGVAAQTVRNWRNRFPEFDRRVLNLLRVGYRPDGASDRDVDLETGRASFSNWVDRYLHMNSDVGHELIAKAVEGARPKRISIVLAPPSVGKTTTLENWVTRLICEQPNTRTTYVHQSGDFAKDVVGRLKSRFTDPETFPELHTRYGPFRPEAKSGKNWSASKFSVRQADHDERDATFFGRGIESRAQGVRADRLLIDDIQDISTLGQTASIMRVLRQTFFTRHARGTIIVMAGNRVGVGDIWDAILDDPELRKLVDLTEIPAIWPDGTSAFPSLYSEEEWDDIRSIVGDDVWLRNYMQKPLAAGNATFPTHDMADSLRSDVPTADDTIGAVTKGWRATLGIDPALGGGCGLVTCLWNADRIIPVDCRYEFGLARNEDIYDLVREQLARHRPGEVIIETSALQKGLGRDERFMELCRSHGARVIEHETHGRGKADPVLGVGAIASDVISGNLVIPASPDRVGRPHIAVEPLWNQLLAWRPELPAKQQRQDLVMALWFVWLHWRREREMLAATGEGWRMPVHRPSMPVPRHALTGRRGVR